MSAAPVPSSVELHVRVSHLEGFPHRCLLAGLVKEITDWLMVNRDHRVLLMATGRGDVHLAALERSIHHMLQIVLYLKK